MAATTVDSPSDSIQLHSISTVDLRFLSKSELYALSLFSDVACNPHRCDDVAIPKVDRSVFNESAGSRKQTYSRLRLAPRKPSIALAAASTAPRRRAHLRTPKSASYTTEPNRTENSLIISLLKGLFVADSYSVQQLPNASNSMKKRGKPRKNEKKPGSGGGAGQPQLCDQGQSLCMRMSMAEWKKIVDAFE